MEKLVHDVNNENRLLQIKAENNILLQRIKRLETKINRLKQNGETPCKKDKNVLNAMVSKSLYFLAEKHTLEVVGTLSVSRRSLQTMIENRYKVLFDRFIRTLYWRRQQRINRTKRLCHLDFQIVQ